MVFEKPKRPGQKAGGSAAVQRPGSPNRPTQRPNRSGGSGGGRRGGGRGGNGRGGGGPRPPGNEPSPWLQHPLDQQPNPSAEAGFVEYLRWMRSPGSDYKDPTKVQIMQLAEDNANYRQRLTELTNRTKRIAAKGKTFTVRCLWRIRVGGHRGPESILLPAFDALGMPYIPSSTLRGVARTQAIRDTMNRNPDITWEEADRQVAEIFGHLSPAKEGATEDEKKAAEQHRAAKVIFLDAYPLPQQSGDGGGLAVDMANNIWSWDALGERLDYSPNPNPFFSLNEATFQIGILKTNRGTDDQLRQVKDWLIQGLKAGIGSQVNTGYGSLVQAGDSTSDGKPLLEVDFAIEGQLIHGRQLFTNWQWNDRRHEWQMRGNPDAEVRPTAFKSMLRYWFRALALGVLPSIEVQRIEAKLFGAISPQTRGWVTVRIANGRVVQREARPSRSGKDDPFGKQSGTLILTASTEVPRGSNTNLQRLCQNLTWLMFHLGGIGQGARRPCYSRRSRERAPWWRGSTLIPETENDMWIELPDTVEEFQGLFRKRLTSFYEALRLIADRPFDPQKPEAFGTARRSQWSEAVDKHCKIMVCTGPARNEKSYALSVLHSDDLKIKDKQGRIDYDGNLCGQVRGGVKPSPVWINDLGLYQVVTVFGATSDPRQRFLQELGERTPKSNFKRIWPLPSHS
jgi:CRISPR-associated protein Cmr6